MAYTSYYAGGISTASPHFVFYKALLDGKKLYRHDKLNNRRCFIELKDLARAEDIRRYGYADLEICEEGKEYVVDPPVVPQDSPAMKRARQIKVEVEMARDYLISASMNALESRFIGVNLELAKALKCLDKLLGKM